MPTRRQIKGTAQRSGQRMWRSCRLYAYISEDMRVAMKRNHAEQSEEKVFERSETAFERRYARYAVIRRGNRKPYFVLDLYTMHKVGFFWKFNQTGPYTTADQAIMVTLFTIGESQ